MNGVRDDDQLVFCPECGAVHDDATELLAEVQTHLANCERDLRSKRAAIKRLQGEAHNATVASPHYSTAMRVLTRWRDLLAPTARELEGKRLENCIARLRGRHTEETLNRSVDGYARFPFVVDHKRSTVGTPAQWYADAELIFRSCGHVNTGIRLAQDQTAQIPHAMLEQVPWMRVKELNRKAIIAYLKDRFGGLLEEDTYLYSPCPRCDDGQELDTPLRIAGLDFQWLAQCRHCGLTENHLLKMAARRQPKERNLTVQLELA